jgi:hypothetical protein
VQSGRSRSRRPLPAALGDPDPAVGERQRPWAPAVAEAAEVGLVMRWVVVLGTLDWILARWDRDPQRGLAGHGGQRRNP